MKENNVYDDKYIRKVQRKYYQNNKPKKMKSSIQIKYEVKDDKIKHQ